MSSSQNISLSGAQSPQINQNNSGSSVMNINSGDLNLLLYPEINYEIHPFARSLQLAKSEKVIEKMRVKCRNINSKEDVAINLKGPSFFDMKNVCG